MRHLVWRPPYHRPILGKAAGTRRFNLQSLERRMVASSAIRVVGRLDPTEALRAEYGFLTETARQRVAILKPGSMMIQQPHLPVPLEVGFPLPSWATRGREAGPAPGSEDPFARFER